jgi:hypothetical protein
LVSPNIAKIGCYSVASGKNNAVRSVETMTPLWPQGVNGASIKFHSTADQCNVDNGYAYNFKYEGFATKGACVNVTTITGGYAQKSMMVNSCSSSANSYSLNFYSGPGCTGTMTTETMKANDYCNDAVYVNGVYGYVSFSCHDGDQHNKCYQNFGISSPSCSATLTQSALKFTCPDKAYSGCATRSITTSTSQYDAQVFGCCI